MIIKAGYSASHTEQSPAAAGEDLHQEHAKEQTQENIGERGTLTRFKRKHPFKLKAYGGLVAARKRTLEDCGPANVHNKQTKISDVIEVLSRPTLQTKIQVAATQMKAESS
ncbi:hypothetical protein AOLI_G00147950 [Acnodon oligacanthus]